jgi:hypothetical protein
MSTQFSTKTAQVLVKILVLFAVVLGGTGLLVTPSHSASASHQSEGIWAHAVNACAIDEDDISEYMVGPGLNLKAGIVGTITARCNVENLPIIRASDNSNTLQLVYLDPDGPGTAYQVIAKLRRLSDSGKVFTLATVDSNTRVASPSFQSGLATFSHDFNFANNVYFVTVTVFQSDTPQVPVAAIVRITRTTIF